MMDICGGFIVSVKYCEFENNLLDRKAVRNPLTPEARLFSLNK